MPLHANNPMSDKKEIHARDYEGPDRRANGGRRPADIIASNWKIVTIIVSIAASVFTAGIAYQTARMALDDKVNRTEFIEKNSEQDKRSALIEKRAERLESVIIDDVSPTLKRLDERVSAMYCGSVQPSLRAACK